MTRLVIIVLALVATLMWVESAAVAATYAIVADRDAHLRSNASGTNFGSITQIQAQTAGNTRRPVIGFTLPAIPAAETITSATIRLWVPQVNATSTVAVHRITDGWAENTVTWSNTSADFNASAEATVAGISTSGVYISFPVLALVNGWRNATFANHGVMLLGQTGADVAFASREFATATQRTELIITTIVDAPALTVLKSSAVVADPFNNLLNPKAIPGAIMDYWISLRNTTNGTVDYASTRIVDAIPSSTELFVGNLGAAGSGPLAFTDGATSCGLAYSFASLGSAADSLSFSNNGGATFAYTPVPDANGYDPAVTHFRVVPGGSFAAKTGAGDPSCSLRLRVRIK